MKLKNKSKILTIGSTVGQKLIDKITPSLWYKYFYNKNELKFNSVQLPKVNRKFS